MEFGDFYCINLQVKETGSRVFVHGIRNNYILFIYETQGLRAAGKKCFYWSAEYIKKLQGFKRRPKSCIVLRKP